MPPDIYLCDVATFLYLTYIPQAWWKKKNSRKSRPGGAGRRSTSFLNAAQISYLKECYKISMFQTTEGYKKIANDLGVDLVRVRVSC